MNTKIITLDINKKIFEPIIAKQGDTSSRFLLFNLFDNGVAFNLTGRSVRAYAIKPDNNLIYNNLVINDAVKGICTLELTTQMLAVEGFVNMELVITEGTKKLSSIPFVLRVIQSLNGDSAVVSTNEFTVLQQALASVQNIDNRFEEVNASLDTKTNLSDISDGVKKIKIVAGILRNDGTGWKFIEDYKHDKLNCVSVTADTSFITVTYNFTAKKILSFVASPDETMVYEGIAVGSSVGQENALIRITKKELIDTNIIIGGYIYYDGTNWDTTNTAGITNCTFSNGILTITHQNCLGYLGSVVCRDGNLECYLGSIGLTTTQIKFYNKDNTVATTVNTNMKVYFTRSQNKSVTLNETIISPIDYANINSNIWFMGVFEVN